MKPWRSIVGSVLCLSSQLEAAVTATILAGGGTALPADTPSGRLDVEGLFPFVGALEISGGSLGNDVETIIGPGDSGGAALRQKADGSWELVGINTFTEGYGGRFGDTGGGVLVEPYEDWIFSVTGIPEPESGMILLLGVLLLARRQRRRVHRTQRRWDWKKRSGRWPHGSNRVIRGGSWNNNARNTRCANRNNNWPDNDNNNIGFRLAQAQPGPRTPPARG